MRLLARHRKLQIVDRAPTSITLGWFDASDYEDGNRLLRGPLGSTFERDAETVMNSGPMDGASRWREFTYHVTIQPGAPPACD
jgi:hypothetical protein